MAQKLCHDIFGNFCRKNVIDIKVVGGFPFYKVLSRT